jgi:hypothetical protein
VVAAELQGLPHLFAPEAVLGRAAPFDLAVELRRRGGAAERLERDGDDGALDASAATVAHRLGVGRREGGDADGLAAENDSGEPPPMVAGETDEGERQAEAAS